MILTKREIQKEKEILEARLDWLETEESVQELSFERTLMAPHILYDILEELGYSLYDTKTNYNGQETWSYHRKENMSDIKVYINGLKFTLLIRKVEE